MFRTVGILTSEQQTLWSMAIQGTRRNAPAGTQTVLDEQLGTFSSGEQLVFTEVSFFILVSVNETFEAKFFWLKKTGFQSVFRINHFLLWEKPQPSREISEVWSDLLQSPAPNVCHDRLQTRELLRRK